MYIDRLTTESTTAVCCPSFPANLILLEKHWRKSARSYNTVEAGEGRKSFFMSAADSAKNHFCLNARAYSAGRLFNITFPTTKRRPSPCISWVLRSSEVLPFHYNSHLSLLLQGAICSQTALSFFHIFLLIFWFHFPFLFVSYLLRDRWRQKQDRALGRWL